MKKTKRNTGQDSLWSWKQKWYLGITRKVIGNTHEKWHKKIYAYGNIRFQFFQSRNTDRDTDAFKTIGGRAISVVYCADGWIRSSINYVRDVILEEIKTTRGRYELYYKRLLKR